MEHSITVTCCACGSKTTIVLGITSTLTCQKCGSQEGIIHGNRTYKAFCQKCGVWFKIKAGIKTDLRHSCGSQAIKVEHGSLINRIQPQPLVEKTYRKVSIVIPVWNKLTLTKNCIFSIRKFTEIPYQLIIVDNGSDLDTIEWLSQNLVDGDIVIKNTANIGFTTGCNQGVKLSTGYYILLLNNDIIVKASDWLIKLIDGLDHADLVGPTCAKVIPDRKAGIFRYVGNGKEDDKWSYIEGWCLFAKKKLFDKLGGFDEQFSPAYSEDADFSFRVRKMGKKILRVPTPVDHIGQQSAKALEKDSPGQSTISNRLLYKKWNNGSVENILIKRAGAFGDVVFTTPIIRVLKKKYPNARLFYETNCPQVLQYNPYVYKLLKTAKEHMFDEIFTLEYEKIPQKNCIDVMAEQANVKLDNRKMDFFLSPLDKKIKIKKPYIILHTGKVWKSRQWSIDRFQKVAEYILSKGVGIVEVGTKSTEMILPGKMRHLYTKFINESWNTIGHLIKDSSFFFGIDSGPSVVAKALQIPSIIIYGCVDPVTRFADSKEFPLYIDILKCSGCRSRTSDTFVECKQKKVYCLEFVTVDMAIEAVDEQLKRLKL